MPTGAYAVSDIENISLTNGNLNIGIALASLPPIAGGKVGFTVRATYNSKLWDAVRAEAQTDPSDPSTKYTVSNLTLSNNGGWRVGPAYTIAFESITEEYNFLPPSGNDPEYNLITSNNWRKVVLTTPDGATHELRPIDYAPYNDGFFNHPYLRGYYKDTPHTVNGSMRYYSYDGSYLWAKIDNSQFCCFGTAQSWTLYLPDGTKVEQLITGEQRITDTNGNKVKIFTTANGNVFTTHYQDELTLREIRFVYDPSGNGGLGQGQVQYQTVGGVWETIVLNYGTTHVFGKHYEFGDSQCPEAVLAVDYQIPVIRSIIYPQTEPGQAGRQFTFTYNSDTTDTASYQFRQNCGQPYETATSESHGWGSLNQITMPSGAIVNYAYTLDGTHYLSGNPDDAPREAVSVKTLTHDGTSDSWQYSNTPFSGGVTAPDGSFVTELRYSSDPGFAHTNSGFGGKEELVYRTISSNKVMAERHWTLMRFSGGENLAAGAQVLVGFNPVVDAEYTSLLDDTPSHNPVKMSAKTFQYDFNGNLLSETHYDWFDPSLVSRDAQGVPTAVPASATVLRVIANSYYNQASGSTSGNVYAKRALSTATPLILNALQQTTLGPSIVQLSYDGQVYGIAPTVGNLTRKQVWDDLDNKWITTSSTYDVYGNLATATDARQKVTTYSYNDLTHALPTGVTVDPQNGTGTHTVSMAYDYSTGLVTSTTDVNGNTASIDYTNQQLGLVDPFGRPGVTIGPLVNVGGVNQHQRVTTTYLDSSRQVIVAADLNAENDKLLKTRTTTDMLGREIKTEQTEDGSNYTIYSLKAYDQMGKITYVSNPMRVNASSNTDGWTRITNDITGRVIEVATFAGVGQPQPTGTPGIFTGRVSTEYVANSTTVTDQAGMRRKSVSDGLGRLIEVYEDPTDSNHPNGLNYLTSYTYDVFGNLKQVNQGGQTRIFSYDSLSRLRNASNPESGLVTYTYDDNGNLSTRSDARQPSVVTTYTYDSINRLVTRSYSDGTPAVTYGYDATNVSNSKGKLTSASSSVSTYSYTGFDTMGRTLTGSQTLGSKTYSLSYTYDLAGHVKSTTYPSTRSVIYSYDSAGRTNAMTGNLGDGLNRNYSTGITYDAGTRMVQEQFGTTASIYNKLFYTSRGQLAEIREGLTPSNDSWERGAIINSYSSSCSGICAGFSMPTNNGNLLKQEHRIPGANGQLVASPTQEFHYDELNRLDWVKEGTTWKQRYTYGRYGNRRIDQSPSNTFGVGIPKPDFGLNESKNQLTAPAGYTMSYDQAGNLTNDTYTGQGQRTFDAENRMKQAWANNQWQTYSYDADGRRVKRNVNGVETWQVYGLDGELLAEYPLNGDPASPQKEYGYRNGQLLISADSGNAFAAPEFGDDFNDNSLNTSYWTKYYAGVPTVSEQAQQLQVILPANTAAYNGVYSNARYNLSGKMVQLELAQAVSQAGWCENYLELESDANNYFLIQVGAGNILFRARVNGINDQTSIPFDTNAHRFWRLRHDQNANLLYFETSANDTVWISRKTVTPGFSLNSLQIDLLAGCYGNGNSNPGTVKYDNVKLLASTAGATSLTVANPSFEAPVVGNGSFQYSPTGASWTFTTGGGISGMNSGFTGSPSAAPDGNQIGFIQADGTISQAIAGFQANTNYVISFAAAQRTNCCNTGGQDIQVYLDSTLLGTFHPSSGSYLEYSTANFTTTAGSHLVKFVGLNPLGGDHTAFIDNVRINGSPKPGYGIQWLVSDQLGTPRMVFDQSGALANVKRHDYLPFGEELFAAARTAQFGYANGDGIRQQFTLKERDVETGLDYFGARYYASIQGRFTSVDPLMESAEPMLPQSWNRYSYVLNNPLAYTDPTGEIWVRSGGGDIVWFSQERWDEEISKLKDSKGNAVYTPLTSSEMEFNTNFGRVRLNPNGPDADAAPGSDAYLGFSIVGENKTDFSVAAAAGIAIGARGRNPILMAGAATLVTVWILTSPVQQGLPHVDDNFYSQSKDNKKKADGLIAAATTELGKLMSDPPGPGGPGDHHKKEIKAILDRAKRIAERLTGRNKADRLKQIEEIEKAASQH
jgi:RHS repeat-associated protein